MDEKYFPSGYSLSRQQFRKKAAALNGQVAFWKIPGSQDDDLYVDHAYWPARQKPENLLVITSGIHGSETYAGAAILNMFMQEILTELNLDKTGVFLVHAMNPYGFKYHQRTTETGVNLNRNFSVTGKLFQKKALDSMVMHERFYSRQPVSSKKSRMLESMSLINGKVYFDDVSLDHFTKAVSPGQFDSEKALEFGGKSLEPQTAQLIEKMRELMPHYKNILGLDLHTGLGDKNRLHLLTSGSGHDLHPELFAKLFNQKEDAEFYVHTPAAAEGFYEVHGALNSMFSDLASPDQQVCAITMEFGTLGHSLQAQIDGLNSFILTHQGRYYGFANEVLGKEIIQEDFERSYPQKDEWREAVICASRGLFTRVLSRAGSL